MPEHQQIQQSKKPDTIFQKQATPISQTPFSNPYSIIQRAKINSKSLTHADIMQLQRTIGNQAVGRLLSSIGNTSTAQQATVQRQEIPEEEEGEETCPSCMQRQENPEEEEPLQGKMIEPVQRQETSEEEELPIQGKFESIKHQEIPEEEPLQTKRENNTGMPDNLKAGVKNLSGIDMTDVRVHYNSSDPAKVGALAYTQGTSIHVAPGQEKHLPHEAWHVVQQAQGRVQATMQLKDGVQVNDDQRLEHEADVMGAQALGRAAQLAQQSTLFRERPGEPLKQGAVDGRESQSARPAAPAQAAAVAADPANVSYRLRQKKGVNLEGGGGQAGDAYERQADAVAEKMVCGQSAEALLDSTGPFRPASADTGSVAPVQRMVSIKGAPLYSTKARRFSTLSPAQERRLADMIRDEKIHYFETEGELISSLREHALAGDTQTVKAKVLDWLRELDPHATVADLLTDTSNSQKVWKQFHGVGYSEADEVMLRSILGGYETHRTGYSYSLGERRVVTDPEAARRGAQAFNAAYGDDVKKKLIEAYRLGPAEAKALEAYTSPNKEDRKNEYYMGGDRNKMDWAPFPDGWAALGSAMQKIPSLGDLGVEITTYRVPRTPTPKRGTDELLIYSRMRPGTNIEHGLEQMSGGQHHYMSTSLTYSVHSSGFERGGAVAITGRSGRYINPFGAMSGSVDGGEILYPPHVRSVYEGANPTGVETSKGTTLPVYHFREVQELQTGEDIVEDNKFAQVRHPSGLEESHHRILSALDNMPPPLVALFHQARERSGVDGPMMYLRTSALLRLTDAFRMEIISKLETVNPTKDSAAREVLGKHGAILYMPLDSLIRLYRKIFSI